MGAVSEHTAYTEEYVDDEIIEEEIIEEEIIEEYVEEDPGSVQDLEQRLARKNAELKSLQDSQEG